MPKTLPRVKTRGSALPQKCKAVVRRRHILPWHQAIQQSFGGAGFGSSVCAQEITLSLSQTRSQLQLTKHWELESPIAASENGESYTPAIPLLSAKIVASSSSWQKESENDRAAPLPSPSDRHPPLQSARLVEIAVGIC